MRLTINNLSDITIKKKDGAEKAANSRTPAVILDETSRFIANLQDTLVTPRKHEVQLSDTNWQNKIIDDSTQLNRILLKAYYSS